MTQRVAFVLATRQRLRANLIARKTLNAALPVASVFLAAFLQFTLCLAQKFFRALKLFGHPTAATFLLDQLLWNHQKLRICREHFVRNSLTVQAPHSPL